MSNTSEKQKQLSTPTPAPRNSDEAIALAFVEQNIAQLRYVKRWSTWLRWNGVCWQEDDTLAVYDSVREFVRRKASSAKSKAAKSIASARTVAAIEKLAKADQRIAATVDQWDCDPWLLNTPAGTVDLKTGALRNHCPEEYLTKLTAIAPDGTCPIWENTIRTISGGDAELITYLQRLLGYALTGSTQEHILAFIYGNGANCKSVFLNTASSILGDYAKTAPDSTFAETHVSQHPTELAALRGARLVTATESDEERYWNEARVKALTGGDRITARLMRQDFFEFTPSFKIIMAGNHTPNLKSVDEGWRRRIHLILFGFTIPVQDRDPELFNKLKAEWPGILAWMIKGCLDWQRQGLSPPPAVVSASAAYLSSENTFLNWLDERCERNPVAWDSSKALFGDWKAFAAENGENPGSSKRFARKLNANDFKSEPKRDARGFRGLRLRSSSSERGFQSKAA